MRHFTSPPALAPGLAAAVLFLAALCGATTTAHGQQTVVANYSGNSLVVLDLATGNRTMLSNSTVGTGTTFSSPVGIARESTGHILTGENAFDARIFRVDPSTGNRTIVAHSTVGTGVGMRNIYGLAVDANGNIIASSTGFNEILSIDPASGNRTVLASSTVGSGPPVSGPWGIAIEPDGNVIVAQNSSSSLIRLNPTTKVRTTLSSSSVGTGPNFANPSGIARLADGSIAVVNVSATDYIIRVDPTTGNRTVITGASVGTGPTIGTRYGVSFDSLGNLYCADFGSNTILRIDPATGNRTVIASASVGTGPVFASPLGILPYAVGSVTNPTTPPIVTSATTASGTYGSSFTYSITADHSPTSYDATGLPSGLTVDTTTGAISGSPTQSGSFNVLISATNADGTGDATLALTIAKAVLTVTGISASDKTYDASNTATLATSSASLSGVASGDTVTLDSSAALATFDDKNVGTGKTVTVSGLSLTGTHSADYTLTQPALTATISARELTVTGLSVENKPYDGNSTATLNTSSSPTLVGVISGDTVTLLTTGATVTFGDKNVGTAKPVTITGLSLSGTDALNYTITSPSLSADITTKALSITGASAANKAYDGTATTVVDFNGASLVGIVSGDAVTLTSQAATGTFDSATAGSAKTVTLTGLSLDGVDSGNYTVTAPMLTADITPALATVSLTGLAQVYDGTARSATVTTVPGSLTTSVTYAGSNTVPTAAGSYGITATVVDVNYTGSESGTLVISKADQLITFPTPPGTLAIGTPITLSATSSSSLPVSFSLVNGNATLTGAELTLLDGDPVKVLASNTGDANHNAASLELTLSAGAKLQQTISFGPLSDKVADEASFTLSATSTSGLPVTFTITSGPAMLSGAQLTLTGASGRVVVQASQSGDATYAAAPVVTQSFEVIAPDRHNVFFGATEFNDSVALTLAPNGSSAILLTYLSEQDEAFVVSLTLAPDGRFEAVTEPLNAGTTDGTASLNGGISAAATAPRTFRGQLINRILAGTIVELGIAFSAEMEPSGGPTAPIAGLYQSSALNAADGTLTSIVGTQGQILVVAATRGLSTGGAGTVDTNGAFALSAPGAAITGSIDANALTVSGSIETPNQPPVGFSGIGSSALRTDRLVNLSSRARIGSTGNDVLITGFVIGGDTPKDVLLRAAGPALTDFGVTNALPNPRLLLFNSAGQVMLENDDWTGSDITAASTRVGAFPLTAGSRDAALLITLPPGVYTMHVHGDGGTGVALAEIYDAGMNPQGEYQRLVNISSRGLVEAGEGALISGFVVTGNSPKKVMVRGAGPSLSSHGVTNPLSDPKLTLHRAQTIVAQNNDWGTPQAVSENQRVATATEIISAAHTTGAFPFATASKDAAIIATLAPGVYTAVVTGVDGATGMALVEVYELPEL